MMDRSAKLQVYEALASVNGAFEQVLADFRHLREVRFFRRDSLKQFQVVIEETRSWVNFEVADVMHSREQNDWARFGRARQQWEKPYADPDDVLIEAGKRKRELRKGAAKRGTKRRGRSEP
jgi:hypothetical protein